jgi:hypothetical protein
VLIFAGAEVNDLQSKRIVRGASFQPIRKMSPVVVTFIASLLSVAMVTTVLASLLFLSTDNHLECMSMCSSVTGCFDPQPVPDQFRPPPADAYINDQSNVTSSDDEELHQSQIVPRRPALCYVMEPYSQFGCHMLCEVQQSLRLLHVATGISSSPAAS